MRCTATPAEGMASSLPVRADLRKGSTRALAEYPSLFGGCFDGDQVYQAVMPRTRATLQLQPQDRQRQLAVHNGGQQPELAATEAGRPAKLGPRALRTELAVQHAV